MKAVSKFVSVLSLGMLSATALSAMTPEQFYLETCRQDLAVPVPVHVVTPLVSDRYVGTTVELEFIVDVNGQPTNVIVKSAADYTVGLFVTEAVQQWKFRPAQVDGQPVARKVELPVRIVTPRRTGDLVASITR
jgi:TonB family protein